MSSHSLRQRESFVCESYLRICENENTNMCVHTYLYAYTFYTHTHTRARAHKPTLYIPSENEMKIILSQQMIAKTNVMTDTKI